MPIEVKNYYERHEMPFLIIFIAIPLMELAIFAVVSEHIGLFTTLLFSLFTAILGGSLVRKQGLQTIMAMRSSMDQGKMPLNEMFDGVCLAAAGALLITPGFLTDTLGFALLFPPVRHFVRHIVKTRTQWAIHSEMSGNSGFSQRTSYDPTIIEGEYENLDENEGGNNDNSKIPLS